MKNRYQYMVNHRLTTLWEDWNIGGAGGGSINHGWAGGPLSLLSQYVAGIIPLTAGWKTFMIRPSDVLFKKIKCSVPLEQGVVILNMDIYQRKINVDCDVNQNFILAVPRIWFKDASLCILNGKEYDIQQLKGIQKKKITFDSEDTQYFYFKIVDKSVKIHII